MLLVTNPCLSDCFDVSATDTTIQNSFCYNQDDCLAINKGSNIKFLNNYCSGGHGISIGSIQEGGVVECVSLQPCSAVLHPNYLPLSSRSTVLIQGNTVVKSDNGIRIKTQVGAKTGSVSNVTYDGNTITDASKFGVVIQQGERGSAHLAGDERVADKVLPHIQTTTTARPPARQRTGSRSRTSSSRAQRPMLAPGPRLRLSKSCTSSAKDVALFGNA